jgi:hypothetical protein
LAGRLLASGLTIKPLFQIQQPLFGGNAISARIAAKTHCSDDAMAGNDDRNWICSVCTTDGSSGAACGDRYGSVGAGLSKWDFLQHGPNLSPVGTAGGRK